MRRAKEEFALHRGRKSKLKKGIAKLTEAGDPHAVECPRLTLNRYVVVSWGDWSERGADEN